MRRPIFIGKIMENIHWYPGHMTKTRRMMKENLKLIDVVIEVLDARAPLSSRNMDLDDLFQGKVRIIVLNKADLVNNDYRKKWVDFFQEKGYNVIESISTRTAGRKKAVSAIERAARDIVLAKQARGINKTVRAMVVGIPNVGKSTFINCIANCATAQTGNKPGVTRGKQWVKITPYLELMDTPGMLWPKLENQSDAQNLAILGTIKDDILDREQLAAELLEKLKRLCPDELCARYKKLSLESSGIGLLEDVCKSRGYVLARGELDTERACGAVLDDFRSGKIALTALQLPQNITPEMEEYYGLQRRNARETGKDDPT